MRDLVFGNTTIAFAIGQINDHTDEAICILANAEGIMASGHAGRVRLSAGPEVERELRSLAPLLLGESYLTSTGKLADRGARFIVHVVGSDGPGAPVQRAALERGLDRALELLDQQSVRALSIPEIGSRIPNIAVESAAAILADALSRRLRRRAALERVTIISLDPAYLQATRDRLVTHGAGEA